MIDWLIGLFQQRTHLQSTRAHILCGSIWPAVLHGSCQCRLLAWCKYHGQVRKDIDGSSHVDCAFAIGCAQPYPQSMFSWSVSYAYSGKGWRWDEEGEGKLKGWGWAMQYQHYDACWSTKIFAIHGLTRNAATSVTWLVHVTCQCHVLCETHQHHMTRSHDTLPCDMPHLGENSSENNAKHVDLLKRHGVLICTYFRSPMFHILSLADTLAHGTFSPCRTAACMVRKCEMSPWSVQFTILFIDHVFFLWQGSLLGGLYLVVMWAHLCSSCGQFNSLSCSLTTFSFCAGFFAWGLYIFGGHSVIWARLCSSHGQFNSPCSLTVFSSCTGFFAQGVMFGSHAVMWAHLRSSHVTLVG